MPIVATLRDWLCQFDYIRQTLALPWHRFAELCVGEYFALGTLSAVILLESAAALDRFKTGEFSRPKNRKPGAAAGKKRSDGA